MAEIKTLKQGETQVLPRTVAEAVNTDSGLSVQAELDALKESTPDVSAQINEHNVAEDAHANRFSQYLPLSGGTITGNINFSGISYSSPLVSWENRSLLEIGEDGNATATIWPDGDGRDGLVIKGSLNIRMGSNSDSHIDTGLNGSRPYFNFPGNNAYIQGLDTDYLSDYGDETCAATKGYVDTKIAAIPTPDVSAQIEAHNTSTAAHANMHWLTADDEMLSSIEPDGSIDADTLEGHPASYFATKTDLENVNVDLSNYYTKEEVDAKITQIQQLIDEAAALVDEINGEVI